MKRSRIMVNNKNKNSHDNQKMLRLRDVEIMTGMKKTFIYEAMRKGDFPRQIRMGARCVAWLKTDIDIWLCERINASRTPTLSQL